MEVDQELNYYEIMHLNSLLKDTPDTMLQSVGFSNIF